MTILKPIFLLIALLLVSPIHSQEDPAPPPPTCMKIPRPDMMTIWEIPEGSPLCNISTSPTSGFSYGIVADKRLKTLRFLTKGFNQTINQMYVSEKSLLGGPYSIAIYRPNLKFSHFVTFEVTNQDEKLYKFDYTISENVMDAQYRTTYYIAEGDIVTKGSMFHHILLGVLLFVQVLVLMSVMGGNNIQFAIAFNTALFIPLSITTWMMTFEKLQSFLIALGICLVVGFAAGMANKKLGNLILAFVCGILHLLFYFFGGTKDSRAYLLLAFVLTMGIPAYCAVMLTIGTRAAKISLIAQFGIFWLQTYLFWSAIFVVTPSEMALRILRGPMDYRGGIVGQGFILVWRNLVSLVVIIGFEALAAYNRFEGDKKTISMDSKTLL